MVVRSYFQDDVAHISIRDHGIGIPPEALETIFERFTRTESAQSRQIPGTGLGLPIVREIARLHGGRIWAERPTGVGSIFHLTLPRLAKSPEVEVEAGMTRGL